MLHLGLMRHGKSSWKEPLPSDHERTLKGRGRRQSRWVADQLIELNWTIDLMLVSTARRAQETAQQLDQVELKSSHRSDQANLYHCSVPELLDLILYEAKDAKSILVIGHEPSLSQTIHHLTRTSIDLKTADCALLSCNAEDWSSLYRGPSWQLRQVVSAPRS